MASPPLNPVGCDWAGDRAANLILEQTHVFDAALAEPTGRMNVTEAVRHFIPNAPNWAPLIYADARGCKSLKELVGQASLPVTDARASALASPLIR